MSEHFTFLGNQELNGILRGRSVPSARAETALSDGLPWVPANLTIGALNTLPADNPFGPVGEIRLMPDPEAKITLAPSQGPGFDLALCDFTTRDGSAWACCPRTALKSAVQDLEAKTGLTMKVAFEHEFTVHGLSEPTHVAFSLSAGRAGAQLAEAVLAILETGGFTLDQFVAEYAPSQYEIAGQPTDPVAAADRTVLTLEAIRAAARDQNLRASFLPKADSMAAGNGVHIHVSFWRGHKNVTFGNDWVEADIGAFLSGVLKAAEPLTLLSNTTCNSYARYRPQSWVGTYVCAGLMNRETMVRVIPRQTASDGSHPGATLEFRTSDATANVYLTLAGFIRAGLDGITAQLDPPVNIKVDPATLEGAKREALHLRHLPTEMETLLGQDTISMVETWLGPDLCAAYVSCRRNDVKHSKELDEMDLLYRVSLVY
ncbi:MAG: glutamine synthetase family protein [Pseudomonadota bacterium]